MRSGVRLRAVADLLSESRANFHSTVRVSPSVCGAASPQTIPISGVRNMGGGDKEGATGAMAVDPKDTVFAKIVSGAFSCDKVYEDEHTLAFRDINPVAPVHVLVVPKEPLGAVSETSDEHALLLGRLMRTANKVAELTGIQQSGFRLVVNNGPNGQQSVHWLHIHVLGGKKLSWPPC